MEKNVKLMEKKFIAMKYSLQSISDKKTHRYYCEYYQLTDRYYEWTDDYYEWTNKYYEGTNKYYEWVKEYCEWSK